MPQPDNRNDAGINHLSILLFTLAAAFCCFEMVPGRHLIGTDWPAPVYYGIMLVFGAVAGMLETPIHWAGALGGACSGVGCLFVLTLFVDGAHELPMWMYALAMAIGALPGYLLFRLLLEIARIVRGESLPPEEQARRYRLYVILAVLGAGAATVALLVNLL